MIGSVAAVEEYVRQSKNMIGKPLQNTVAILDDADQISEQLDSIIQQHSRSLQDGGLHLVLIGAPPPPTSAGDHSFWHRLSRRYGHLRMDDVQHRMAPVRDVGCHLHVMI